MPSSSTSDTHEQWWRGVRGGAAYPFDVVVGARRSGKSTFLRTLAHRDPSVRYWSLLTNRRSATVEDVWDELFEVMFGTPSVRRRSEDVSVELHRCLQERGDLVLVVDNWDDAIAGPGIPVGDAYYEALDALYSHCYEQSAQPGPYLGLVLVTSLPGADDLELFSRSVQRETFRRLSGFVARQMRTTSFPFLSSSESVTALSPVVPPVVADRMAAATGGWWALLDGVSESWGARPDAGAEEPGRASDHVLGRVSESVVPELLDASLWPALRKRSEAATQGLHPRAYLSQELAKGRHPAEFGLPGDFTDPSVPAPLINEHLGVSLVFVDMENIRVPFAREHDVHPERYPVSVEDTLRGPLSAWIRRTAERYRVPLGRVTLCSKSEHLLDRMVDDSLAGVHRTAVPRAIKGKSGTDDALLGMFLCTQAERYRNSTVILLTGDKDIPLLLEKLGFDLQRLVVESPWGIAATIQIRRADFRDISENCLDLPRPTDIPDRVVNEARRRRARQRQAPPEGLPG